MNGGCAERIVAGWRNRRHDGGDVRFRMDAARGWVVDHMGNRTPQALEGGTVRWPCTSRPSALALKVDDSDGEGRDLWMGLADPVALRYR